MNHPTLLLYYSQSGEGKRVVNVLQENFLRQGIAVTTVAIKPRPEYPYPWSFFRFFGVQPETQLGITTDVEDPEVDFSSFEQIFFVYPVWFLAPALPVQSFLASPFATGLSGKKIVTITVCRKMALAASAKMKAGLEKVGAEVSANIVLTHQGNQWQTLITTPLSLLLGKRRRFASTKLRGSSLAALNVYVNDMALALKNKTPVPAPVTYMARTQEPAPDQVAEPVFDYVFHFWAGLIRRHSQPGTPLRSLLATLLFCQIVAMILVILPLCKMIQNISNAFRSKELTA